MIWIWMEILSSTLEPLPVSTKKENGSVWPSMIKKIKLNIKKIYKLCPSSIPKSRQTWCIPVSALQFIPPPPPCVEQSPSPLFLMLVRIQQMSSHRLKPQFWRQSRPRSSPSLEPHHRNTKLRGDDTSAMSSAIIWSAAAPNMFAICFMVKESGKFGIKPYNGINQVK